MRTAARGWRHGTRGPVAGFAAWLAVLAVLAQTVLFEHAMAAEKVAAAQARATVHHHDHGAGEEPAPERAPHQHDQDCPFCLARASNQGLSLGVGLVLPRLAVVVVAPPSRGGRLRVARRPARIRCRSPPIGS